MATRVEAQVAGTVWKIETREGQELASGEVIMILESMKMEIPVEAPCAGRVSHVLLAAGGRVSAGQALVVLEAAE